VERLQAKRGEIEELFDDKDKLKTEMRIIILKKTLPDQLQLTRRGCFRLQAGSVLSTEVVYLQLPSSLDNFSFDHSFFIREHSGLIKLLPILSNPLSIISKSYLNLRFTSKFFI